MACTKLRPTGLMCTFSNSQIGMYLVVMPARQHNACRCLRSVLWKSKSDLKAGCIAVLVWQLARAWRYDKIWLGLHNLKGQVFAA